MKGLNIVRITGRQGTGKTRMAMLFGKERCGGRHSERGFVIFEDAEDFGRGFSGIAFHTVVLDHYSPNEKEWQRITSRLAPDHVILIISNE